MMPGQGQNVGWTGKPSVLMLNLYFRSPKVLAAVPSTVLTSPIQGHWARCVSGGIAVLNLLAGPATTIPFRVP